MSSANLSRMYWIMCFYSGYNIQKSRIIVCYVLSWLLFMAIIVGMVFSAIFECRWWISHFWRIKLPKSIYCLSIYVFRYALSKRRLNSKNHNLFSLLDLIDEFRPNLHLELPFYSTKCKKFLIFNPSTLKPLFEVEAPKL